MAATIVSAQSASGFVGDISEDELGHDSRDETLHFSNLTASPSKDEPSSSSSKDEEDSGYEAVEVKKPCGICFEDSAAEMLEGINCLHRFCHPCMTKYIISRLEQKRPQIYCPHESCLQTLTPQECGYFLPVEIMEAWSALNVEADISEMQKVYCPFPDCSAIVLKEDPAEEMVNPQCSSCKRMLCVRCMVPWHADINCEEFQALPQGERSEEDIQLFKLAEAQKWQRCGKCKSMIELTYGCNHMTCRCGHQFCYGCGTGWMSGGPTCNCSRTNENRPPAA